MEKNEMGIKEQLKQQQITKEEALIIIKKWQSEGKLYSKSILRWTKNYKPQTNVKEITKTKQTEEETRGYEGSTKSRRGSSKFSI